MATVISFTRSFDDIVRALKTYNMVPYEKRTLFWRGIPHKLSDSEKEIIQKTFPLVKITDKFVECCIDSLWMELFPDYDHVPQSVLDEMIKTDLETFVATLQKYNYQDVVGCLFQHDALRDDFNKRDLVDDVYNGYQGIEMCNEERELPMLKKMYAWVNAHPLTKHLSKIEKYRGAQALLLICRDPDNWQTYIQAHSLGLTRTPELDVFLQLD